MTRRPSHIRYLLGAGLALVLQGCGAERAPTGPAVDRLLATAASADGGTALVVDNDGADCPQADFTSIQAAVLAAQPGDKILVCPGVYSENVLVEKADLRIHAQGAPGEVVLQGPAAGPYGFHLRNTTGVVLQGFQVQGYADANIIIDRGSGNTLRKNIATEGLVDGIEVLGSSANVIEQNVSFGNAGPVSDGIFVWQGASDNIIRHNESFNNGQHGINLSQSGPGNVVFGNSAHGNRVRGIQSVQQSNGTVIDNNHVFANGTVAIPGVNGVGVGIFVLNSTGVSITNNRSEKNGSNGIALNSATNNVVSNNRSDSNTVAGIALNGASNNLVEKNEVFRNGQDGIRLQNNADQNVVQLNQVFWHSRDGIRVLDLASGGNTIERNVIRDGGEHDAHDDSVGPATGGTANFWLKNHCETENRPGLCEHKAGGA